MQPELEDVSDHVLAKGHVPVADPDLDSWGEEVRIVVGEVLKDNLKQ